MTQGPEVVQPAQAESPKAILARVERAASQLNPNPANPLSPEQRGQVVSTVIDGVIKLHKQGQIIGGEPVCKFLQTRVFAADPEHKVLASALVAGIEDLNTGGKNPQAVKSLLQLSSLLGINDPGKYPDLTDRLETVSAGGVGGAGGQTEKPKADKKNGPRKKRVKPKEIPENKDDFIPYADASQPEIVDETSDDQSALVIGLGDVINYLPDTPANREMLSQIGEGSQPALLRLTKLAAERGYSDRAVKKLTGLFARDPERAEEVIPILDALSASDPANTEVYQLLGDSYLQLGMHKEAIAAYMEKLKRPPKE